MKTILIDNKVYCIKDDDYITLNIATADPIDSHVGILRGQLKYIQHHYKPKYILDGEYSFQTKQVKP